MIPIAFKFQARFPSAALLLPSGFNPDARGGAAQDWYPTRGLNCDNHRERVASVLPDVEDLIRREQTHIGVSASHTVLIGFSQGGTVALEAVKTAGLAGAVVAFSSRYARLPARGMRISSRIHLVHGAYDSVVSRVYAERAARVLAGLHVPVTLDIVDDLGHALSHRAISLGSLRLLQGIYEGRRATLH
jgi:phospholipase/carboxylesterase